MASFWLTFVPRGVMLVRGRNVKLPNVRIPNVGPDLPNIRPAARTGVPRVRTGDVWA